MVFKMGGNFRTCTLFREANTFPFCIHILILVLSEPLYLLARHDILISSRMLIVRRVTLFCFYHVCHLLKRHDIYDFTTMPSFEAPRYL